MSEHVDNEQPGETLIRRLGELAEHADLARVLAEDWESIRDAIWTQPIVTTAYSPLDRLIHLVLRLGRRGMPNLGDVELAYLVDACRTDPMLLSHLLTWAGASPHAQESASAWVRLAEWWREIFPAENDAPKFRWTSPVGRSLARRQAAGVDLDELYLDHWPELSPRDLLAALAKLDSALLTSLPDTGPIIENFLDHASTPKIGHTGSRPHRDIARFLALLDLLPLSVVLDKGALKAGQALGYALFAHDQPRTSEFVAVAANRDPHLIAGGVMCEVALLWADLHQVAHYQKKSWENRDAISGVLARLVAHLDSAPRAWALSASELLPHVRALGEDISDLLVLGAVQHPVIHTELGHIALGHSSSAVRDQAQGLLARIAGLSSPGEDARRWLADAAAKAFDGAPLFPNPLTPLARTWLGTTDVEATLSTSIRQAMTHFAEEARGEGAIAVEEHLTGALLTELKAAFRGVSLRLTSGGRSSIARMISVGHRTVHKATEEPLWGCDVAFVLNARVHSEVRMDLAELVQVKKSERFAAGRSSRSPERWRIDVAQLTTLLARSQSAAYWLILSSGEVLCVPARWIHSLARGRDALRQKTMTVGYNDVRHPGVLVEQFLAELFLGTWVGSAEDSTLAFARGEDTGVTPRHIFEISVTLDRG